MDLEPRRALTGAAVEMRAAPAPPPADWRPVEAASLRASLPAFDPEPRAIFRHGSLLRLHLDSSIVVARRIADAARAESLHRMTAELASRCAHVPAPRLLEGRDGSRWLCAPWLEGRTWQEERGSQADFARALASLHGAMRELPAEPIAAASRARKGRALDWLARNAGGEEVAALARAAGLGVPGLRSTLEAWLARPGQPIHNDLHAGNVWWSGGSIWFLDLEEMADSHLPASADVMRYVERHLLVEGLGFEAPGLAELWRNYHAEAGADPPDAAHAFAAVAWNWIDSWSALQRLGPQAPEYEDEKSKFLGLLRFHGANWRAVAAGIDAQALGPR